MLFNESYERRRKFITKIHANLSFFRRVSCFRKRNSRKCWQFPISFCKRVSRFWGVSVKSGALLFLPCSHKIAVVHMFGGWWTVPPCRIPLWGGVLSWLASLLTWEKIDFASDPKFPNIGKIGPQNGFFCPQLVILRACYRAQKPRIPKIRKNKTKSPTPGWNWSPKIRKNTEKDENDPRTAIFELFFVFFRYFFRIFGGQPGGRDFVCFSCFRDSGFLGSVAGPQDHKPHQKIGDREWGVPGGGFSQYYSWLAAFLCEAICFCKGILTRNWHFACYCDARFEDKSTIAKTPFPKTPHSISRILASPENTLWHEIATKMIFPNFGLTGKYPLTRNCYDNDLLRITFVAFRGFAPSAKSLVMSVKYLACDASAGNGCANCIGAWDFLVLPAGKLGIA